MKYAELAFDNYLLGLVLLSLSLLLYHYLYLPLHEIFTETSHFYLFNIFIIFLNLSF